MSASPDSEAIGTGRSAFLPLLMLLFGFITWMAFQATQLIAERRAMNTAIAQQAEALTSSQKLRAACDSLASKTQMLANRGNANAESVIAELKKRGVTINTAAPSPVPP